MPSTSTSTPPTAAPNTRARFMDTELRVTALARSSGGTISEMKLCLAGLSKTFTQPSESASRYTDHISMRCAPVRMGKTPGRDPLQSRGDIQDPPLAPPVGEQAARRAEQQDRQEADRRDQPERRAGVRKVKDEERLSHRLHPGPHHRDELPEEEQPVVPVPQGRADPRCAEPADAGRAGPGGRAGRCYALVVCHCHGECETS